MNKTFISRRRFLKYGGLSSITGKYFLSGTAGLLHALSAYATEPDSLNESDIKLLFSILKQMYPHNVLHDQHYQTIIEKLIVSSAKDKEVNNILKNGISELNSKVKKTMVKNTWVESSPAEQHDALKKISKTQFFSTLKQTTINNLYNNHDVWELFGYEGDAFSKGGYIHRGFNDLDWLPEPPIEDSPKI